MVEKVPKCKNTYSRHDDILQVSGNTGGQGIIVARTHKGGMIYAQAQEAATEERYLQTKSSSIKIVRPPDCYEWTSV